MAHPVQVLGRGIVIVPGQYQRWDQQEQQGYQPYEHEFLFVICNFV
jgi:hypothetical protein